jgi:hypothetical protein
VNKAWKVGASAALAAFAIVVEPSGVEPAGAGTTPRYALLRKLRSSSWAVVAIDHQYPTHQNHWSYSVPV